MLMETLNKILTRTRSNTKLPNNPKRNIPTAVEHHLDRNATNGLCLYEYICIPREIGTGGDQEAIMTCLQERQIDLQDENIWAHKWGVEPLDFFPGCAVDPFVRRLCLWIELFAPVSMSCDGHRLQEDPNGGMSQHAQIHLTNQDQIDSIRSMIAHRMELTDTRSFTLQIEEPGAIHFLPTAESSEEFEINYHSDLLRIAPPMSILQARYEHMGSARELRWIQR